jgi:hypothetical protein
MATQGQLIEEINAARTRGWLITRTGLGYLITDPESGVDHRTPDNWPRAWWDGPTFRKLFQLSVTTHNEKIILVTTRVATAPGGACSESKVSFAKAIEFLKERHGS